VAKVGFVGLGNMGMPIAANLAKAGHDVRAHDLSPARLEEAKGHGVSAAGSLAGAVDGRDFLVTVLPMPRDVETVATEAVGLVGPEALYIDMSTIDPMTVRRIGALFRERGSDMIDAPITRSIEMAWQARSALLLGGDPASVERAMPVLGAVSDLQTYCGPLGAGAAMKLANNYLAHGMIALLAETLGFGIKAGITLETMMAAIERSGTYNKILLEVLPTRAFKGDFTPGFKSTLALKDQRLAIGLAEEVGVDVPVGRLVEAMLAEVAAEDPGADVSGLFRRQERRDGFTARLERRADTV
jgi:3-hydroxyisobutyrate dehydrogenase-like beta-hydroxyacid dehydrogenase